MSRAFVFEWETNFSCKKYNRECKNANLRGGCDLDKCEFINEIESEAEEQKKADN